MGESASRSWALRLARPSTGRSEKGAERDVCWHDERAGVWAHMDECAMLARRGAEFYRSSRAGWACSLHIVVWLAQQVICFPFYPLSLSPCSLCCSGTIHR